MAQPTLLSKIFRLVWGPNGIAYDQRNGDVYVSNSMNGTISLIDGLTNTVTDTITLESNSTPNGILYNPDTDSVFVADTNTSKVHVIKESITSQ
jgi:YVTN family beta-propeller protein